MFESLRRKWQSLVFRLLFYFLLSLVALAIALGVSFAKRIEPYVQNEVLPNVERYVEYLIDDIGVPPDLVVAGQLAAELPFELRIEGPGFEWSSSPRLDSIEAYDYQPAPPPYDDVYIGHGRRNQYLLVQQAGYRYLFAVDDSFRQGARRRHWGLFVALGLVLFGLYIAIRQMLKPIEEFSDQVGRIGQGDLERTLDERGNNELARLAAGINLMSTRIRSMLESKSSLLLAISHELRSPLTRMRVNLELLEDSRTRQKLIDDLREMESLVAAILESEKLGSAHAPLNLRPCQLMQLIEDVVAAHPSCRRIRTRLTPVEINADELRLRLLLKNLLDNACHYSAEGDSLVDLRLEREAGTVVFEVEDRGSGIDAEDLPRLTEAFYRPDRARRRNTGGYGLGLYLCQLIVDAHGGHITIESEPGKGTRVIVSLPLDNS